MLNPVFCFFLSLFGIYFDRWWFLFDHLQRQRRWRWPNRNWCNWKWLRHEMTDTKSITLYIYSTSNWFHLNLFCFCFFARCFIIFRRVQTFIRYINRWLLNGCCFVFEFFFSLSFFSGLLLFWLLLCFFLCLSALVVFQFSNVSKWCT